MTILLQLMHAENGNDLATRMDLAMQQMREGIKAGQEETALKLARSGRRDRKGDENQFRFCED